MQQKFKTTRLLAWPVLLIAGLFFSGCSGNSKKTGSDSLMNKSTDTVSAKTTPADTSAKSDSLPPIDTTVTHRPETRKT